MIQNGGNTKQPMYSKIQNIPLNKVKGKQSIQQIQDGIHSNN